MYHFFVADEPPVPSWPYTPPRDPAAVDTLVEAYFDSGYDIKSMLRTLFTSDFFKAEDIRYEKVKSPAEFVAGVLRLTGEFDRPRREIMDRAKQMVYMGQHLNNPPSVEGWHQGVEWLDTGTLVERINFASEQFGDLNKPGVKAMVESIASNNVEPLSSQRLVNLCLEQMGDVQVSDASRDILVDFAEQSDRSTEAIAGILRLSASADNFQRS